jgi:SAM-dependent methyltransferase
VGSRRDLTRIRQYYAKILPFYEKETAGEAVRFWRGLARLWRPARILEIGSGLGRVSAALAREARVLGIDVSLEMLRHASRRRGSRARFVAEDMREVVFGCSFDLIVAPGDALCHWTKDSDRRKALRSAAALLSPGGRFVLEGLSRQGRKTLSFERRVRYPGGALEIAETWRPAGRRGLWRATYRYRDRPSGRRARTLEASFLARAWDPAEVRPLFAACGLIVEESWGDFRRRPFGPGSDRLIVVARPSARFLHQGA